MPSPVPEAPNAHLLTLLKRQDMPGLLDQLLGLLPDSAVSKRNILSGWRLYVNWLELEGGSLREADQAQAQAYAAWLQQNYAAPATVNNRLTQVRKLYRLFQTQGLSAENPFEQVHGLVNPAHERRPYYTEAEIERLLAQAEPELQVLVLLGAHAGLTGPEVLQLQHEDCTPDTVQAGLRTVPCSPELAQALRVWRQQLGERPLLGLELRGAMFGLKDDQELRSAVWRLCQRANVMYRGWYALRNAAGIRLLPQAGARETERQLGIGGRAALQPTARLVRGQKEQE